MPPQKRSNTDSKMNVQQFLQSSTKTSLCVKNGRACSTLLEKIVTNQLKYETINIRKYEVNGHCKERKVPYNQKASGGTIKARSVISIAQNHAI